MYCSSSQLLLIRLVIARQCVCHRSRFQLILPVDSQNVTKYMTGHRMHVAGP